MTWACKALDAGGVQLIFPEPGKFATFFNLHVMRPMVGERVLHDGVNYRVKEIRWAVSNGAQMLCTLEFCEGIKDVPVKVVLGIIEGIGYPATADAVRKMLASHGYEDQ